MKFSKAIILVQQFGVLKSLGFVFTTIINKIFDPYNISSYSQTGEDRIIGFILSENGFYVDVGCNHPQAYSNTFALYKKGWHGVTIDANKDLVCKHQKIRKHDVGVCAVVSDKEQQSVFTDFSDPLVSSLDKAHVSEWSKHRKIKEQRVVITTSLNTILKKCQVPSCFDLLTIDVEGHDFEVLISFDINYYRPKLIVIEMHGFDFLNPSGNRVYDYLKNNKYKMLGYILENGYFSDDL